ncbi:MAG: IclR family transcriptional regulator [Aeromicrobium sp.]
MPRPVPAATAALHVLRYLSRRPVPTPAARIADDLGLPRSSTYHLLAAMAEQAFVTHYADDRTWGVGVAAWEVGQGYSVQEPLARLARTPLATLVDTVGQSAHLAVLHGAEVLYIIEERGVGKPPLVSDTGVRLPAHLTASGRAILAALPAGHLRAVFPGSAPLVLRTESGPRTRAALGRILVQTRRRGWATEDGEVTAGYRSVAMSIRARALTASVAVTWAVTDDVDVDLVLEEMRRTTQLITARLGGREPT